MRSLACSGTWRSWSATWWDMKQLSCAPPTYVKLGKWMYSELSRSVCLTMVEETFFL